MNRYKPVGWRGESYRHYLAAKGISTNRKYFDKIYSVRDVKERFTGEPPKPSDQAWRGEWPNMRGRSTGWFGTGFYGFNTRDKALEFRKDSDTYIREFDVNAPLKFTSDMDAEEFHDTSRALYHVQFMDEDEEPRRISGLQIQNSKEDHLSLIAYRLSRLIGKDVSVKDVQESFERSKESGEQPINEILKMHGYDGVIPTERFQTGTFGSVKYPDDSIGIDEQPLDEEVIQRRPEILDKKRKENLQRVESARKRDEEKSIEVLTGNNLFGVNEERLKQENAFGEFAKLNFAKKQKENGFARAGEIGVNILKTVYVDTTKWGYRKGKGNE